MSLVLVIQVSRLTVVTYKKETLFSSSSFEDHGLSDTG